MANILIGIDDSCSGPAMIQCEFIGFPYDQNKNTKSLFRLFGHYNFAKLLKILS